MKSIITRRQAVEQGLSRYFTGKPCKHNHVAERNTANGGCSTCHLGRQSVQNQRYDHRLPRSRPTTRGQTGRTALDVETLRARSKAYVEANPEKVKADGRRHYDENKATINSRARSGHLMRVYGITQEEYDQIMLDHNGLCDICDSDQPGGPHKKFNLDHCHSTGKIRGVLCARCNTSLGQFEDRIDLLQAAIAYLMKS